MTEQMDELRKAWEELCDSIFEALHIPQLTARLSRWLGG